MAWSLVGHTYVGPAPRDGWHISRTTVINTVNSVVVEERSFYLKWDHVPTNADKDEARDRIIDQLTNPPPPAGRWFTVKAQIKAIGTGAGTAAQRLTAIGDYVDSILSISGD